jgi:hypothetical protein
MERTLPNPTSVRAAIVVIERGDRGLPSEGTPPDAATFNGATFNGATSNAAIFNGASAGGGGADLFEALGFEGDFFSGFGAASARADLGLAGAGFFMV